MNWRDFLLTNLRWKLISLALATVLWLGVQSAIDEKFRPLNLLVSAERTSKYAQLPVGIFGAPQDRRAFRLRPGTVDVTVSGQAGALQNLKEKDLRVFVDLTETAETATGPVKVRVHAPAGVSVLLVQPDEVTLESTSPGHP